MISQLAMFPFRIIFHIFVTGIDPYQRFSKNKKTGKTKAPVLRGWKYETLMLFLLASWIGMGIADFQGITDAPIWMHWIVYIALPLQVIRYARLMIIRLDQKDSKTKD